VREAWDWRAVLAPAAFSLLLNLAGLTWGLPERWHPDEKADGIAGMARGLDLRPDSFVNPSLPLYVQLPFVWMQQRASDRGLLAGLGADTLFLCRIFSALAGGGAVLVLGLVAVRTAPGQAPWAAWFLAAAPGFVNLCHFATPESWLLLGCAATLLLGLEHAAGRAPAWLLGLVLGLTTSTKYTGAALLPAVVAAVWLRDRSPTPRRDLALLGFAGAAAWAVALALAASGPALATELHLKDARLLHPASALAFVQGAGRSALMLGAAFVALALLRAWPRTSAWAARLARGELVVVGLLALLGFLLGTPFAAKDPIAFLSDLAFNAQTRAEYKGLVGAETSFVAYLAFLGDALTWPLVAAAAVGLGVALSAAGREPSSLILLLGAVAPYLLVASSGHRALRFLAPVLPAAAWLAARGISGIIRDRKAAGVVQGTMFARAALGSLLVIRLFFTDSRREAERWIERHVPLGSTVDLIANHAGYAPRLPEGRTLRLVPTLSREMAPKERFTEAAARYPAEASAWLILTASFYERFLEHPDQQPERARFFGDLLAGRGGFEVAARFRQQGFWRPEVEFVDPEIVILRKQPDP
jgi:Dolichyl-phosphate-mannose-protein mannosyltransferase